MLKIPNSFGVHSTCIQLKIPRSDILFYFQMNSYQVMWLLSIRNIEQTYFPL